MMDASSLIDTTLNPDLPAPYWFVELFKVLGFTLHAVPMNLWYAGVVLSLVLYVTGSEHGQRLAGRLMLQMPVIVAYGVNLGIVPLLFIQLAYAKFFYPATILMAWFWFAVIVVLTVAYYGVYILAFGVRAGAAGLRPWRLAAGWLAALAFLAIGFTFANALSLTTNVGGWPELWGKHSVAGAATGTGLNLADASLWPRWLMMFGLALTTTAAWAVFDAGWLAGGEGPDYKRWIPRFALKLYSVGLVWFAVAGSWYVFGTWRDEAWQAMVRSPWVILTIVTALSPGLPWLLIFMAQRRGVEIGRGWATLVGLAQFGVLGINAVSRQIVQNVELRPYFDVAAQPLAVQWSPLVAFLATFVVGLAVVAWMVAQVARAAPEETLSAENTR